MNANASVEFLNEAARYFAKRPTGGEDQAHWSNVLNAENCTKTADLVASQEARIEQLEKIVRQFVTANDDGSGLIDCIDNSGERYTSQYLANVVTAARSVLSTQAAE